MWFYVIIVLLIVCGLMSSKMLWGRKYGELGFIVFFLAANLFAISQVSVIGSPIVRAMPLPEGISGESLNLFVNWQGDFLARQKEFVTPALFVLIFNVIFAIVLLAKRTSVGGE